MSHLDNTLAFHSTIFSAVEQFLSELTGNDSLPFDTLFAKVCGKLNLSIEQINRMKQPIRDFVHTHPSYRVRSGHKGGIERVEAYVARSNAKQAKVAVKREVMAMIEAKVKEAL